MIISSVKDGSIVRIKNSVYAYMKVCDKNGVGGVVNLMTGLYTPVSALRKDCKEVTVLAKNLDEFFYKDDEEVTDRYTYDDLGTNWW